MRKFVIVLIALTVTSATMTVAFSCGDKTMRVGRGLRFHQLQAKKHPSNILIHTTAVAPGKAPRLQHFLKDVGHTASTFDDVSRVNEVLKTAQYDVLLTTPADAAGLQRQVATVSPQTVVVPVILKSDEAGTARQYKFVVNKPQYAEDFLEIVHQVMKSRSKRI